MASTLTPDEIKKAENQLTSLSAAQYLMGAMGILSLVLSGLSGLNGSGAVARLNHLMWTGEVGFYMITTMITSVVISLFLIGTGYVTAKLVPLARTLTLAHVGLGFANGLYHLVVVFGVLVPALFEFAKVEGAPGIGGAIGGVVGGAVGGLFSLLFPAIELWMISRPNVREVLSSRPVG